VVRKTVGRLADGREIIYFDERDGADRTAVDRRELPPRAAPAELRYDASTDEWVAVATARQGRIFLPPTHECPLCPATAEWAGEIPAADYDVVVFENRFPSFQDPGRCEVVCFTSEHGASFASLTPERVRTVVDAWADRTAELSTLDGVAQVFPFENRGVEIGVTLHHPHGQIYAYPYVTPRTRQMLAAARRHPTLFADLLAAERAASVRVIAANEYWTAFVPEAARWPYEVHLYPHRQLPDLAALSDAERDAFGPLYLDILARCDRLFDAPLPYISGWYQAPVGPERELGYLHLRLFTIRRTADKLKYLAGSESAMGAFINDVRPEDAADRLRGAGH